MYIKKQPTEEYFVLDIGDIHFSPNNAEHLYMELEEYLFGTIKENADVLDMIVISGDLFHCELKMSSQAARYAYAFVANLIDICEKNKIVLRIIKGTETHDFGQVNTIGVMYPNKQYFKVITKVEEEEVFRNFKVLYIPEEYPKDYREYYNDLVYAKDDNFYDFVFFHGTVEFQSFSSQKIESERHIESAPVWKCNDLIRICKGPVTGGHIHKACNFKEKIFYHGSFSRMAQGEEDSKGFNIYDYIKNENFEVVRVDNDLAPLFKQIDIEDTIVENGGNVEEIIKDLDRIFSKEEINFRVNLSKDVKDNYPEIHHIIREYLAGKKNVDIKDVVSTKINLSSESAASEEQAEKEENRMSFLANRSMSVEEKIQKFAKDILNEDLDLNDVQLVISNS